MAMLSLGGQRVWITPVDADPTGSITPSQAPVIAVLATNPAPGETGCWYNAGTSPLTWRPLVSSSGAAPYVLPEDLQRLHESGHVDEEISLLHDLAAARPDYAGAARTWSGLPDLIGRIFFGRPRAYYFDAAAPEVFTTGMTLVLRTVLTDSTEEVVRTFVFNKGDVPGFAPGAGEIEVNISACTTAAEIATALSAVLRANLWCGRDSTVENARVTLQTGFCGQALQGPAFDPDGTAFAAGALSYYEPVTDPAKNPVMDLHSVVLQLLHASQVQQLSQEIPGGLDPRAEDVAPLVFGRTVAPEQIGQLLVTPDGTKAYRRTGPASRMAGTGIRDFVALHRTKTFRDPDEQPGVLFGYFDSPLLYAVQARRDVRLRWIILGVNSAAEAKNISLGLRVHATGDVTAFTMAKAIHTMGTPSEGPVVLHQNIAGLDSSGNGEVPLLLDFNLPIQSNGSGGNGIAAGGSFGVCLEMRIRIPHQLDISNSSGLGNNVDLQRDLKFFRIDWDAWYRDIDNANPTPLAHAHGEAQIFDSAGGLAFEIERLGIQAKTPGVGGFWEQVSAIDGGSYVEIEYL